MKTFEIKYYGGSVDVQATSTKNAIKVFEETYQDHWYAAGPKAAPIKTPEADKTDLFTDNVPF